jgi:hypothetical protein
MAFLQKAKVSRHQTRIIQTLAIIIFDTRPLPLTREEYLRTLRLCESPGRVTLSSVSSRLVAGSRLTDN